MRFEIIPAIDLKDGRCVRLRQGRAEDATVYSDDPLSMARHWVAEGATRLHVVDLDGAFEGWPVHREVVATIAAGVPVPIQAGGGLRTDEDISSLLAAGVDRVILGTRAVRDLAGLRALVERFGARLVVGIDARGGRVQTAGWREETDVAPWELGRDVAAAGVHTVIYTETGRDGMLQGPAVELIQRVAGGLSCAVIASGGVSSVEDVRRLMALRLPNLAGAIVGKALYEGLTSVRALQAVAEGEGD